MEVQHGSDQEWQQHCESCILLVREFVCSRLKSTFNTFTRERWGGVCVCSFFIDVGRDLFFLPFFKLFTKCTPCKCEVVVYICELFCVYHLYCS